MENNLWGKIGLWLGGLVIIAAVAWAVWPPRAPMTYQTWHTKLSPSVVKVHCYYLTEEGLQIRSHGSGIIISKTGHILTARHVVQGSMLFEIEVSDKKRYKAALLGYDMEQDLAILQPIRWPSFKVKPLRKFATGEIGHPVFHIGYPVYFLKVLSAGVVSGHTDVFLITDTNIASGSSGGPLFDMKGRIVGIANHIPILPWIPFHTGYSAFIQASYAEAFINSWEEVF